MKNFLLVAAAALSIVGMAMPVSTYAADPAGAASAAPAQQITVNGAVIDENGDPIAGASVLEHLPSQPLVFKDFFRAFIIVLYFLTFAISFFISQSGINNSNIL